MDGKQPSYAKVAGCGNPAPRPALAINVPHYLALIILTALMMLPVLPAHAQWVTDSVPTGNNPHAIGVNPVTNRVYVANAGDGTLTIIDGATHSAMTIAVGSNPQALVVNPVTNKVYVANSHADGTVTVIDGDIRQMTTLAVGNSPSALAVNPLTNRVYVASQGATGTVAVIDGASDTVIATLSVGGSPSDVAVDSSANRIYVANRASDSVTVVNGADNSTAKISTGAGSSPVAVGVNSVTHKVYVACQGTGRVAVIDESTRLTSLVAVGAGVTTLALDSAGNRVYAVAGEQNQVTVIDGTTDTVVASVAVGAHPLAVAFNSATGQIYTANAGDNTVTAIDAASGHSTTLAVGAGPTALAVDIVTNKIYVASESSNTVSVIDGATNTLSKASVGSNPTAVLVNPAADKIYVASPGSNRVTVLDDNTHSTTDVATGNSPRALALNPLTNKVYVANFGDRSVTVVDGATNAPTTIDLGGSPRGVAVNPATNRIYVATASQDALAVIDGTAGSVLNTIVLGVTPAAVAVNPVTNTIYASSPSGNSLVMIDGATSAASLVAVGHSPRNLAVNPVTNRVYVVNAGDNTVTVIDGSTGSAVATVAVGNGPRTVAVNPITNRAYVANFKDNTVTVIDGLTHSTTTVTLGNLRTPIDLAVNPASNKIYVAGQSSGNIAVIDGVSGVATTLAGAEALKPHAVAINPLTGKVYVSNQGSSSLTILPEQPVHASLLQASVLPLADDLSTRLAPQLEFSATSSPSLRLAAPSHLLYQVDTWQGPWQAASSVDGARYSGSTPALVPGFHVLYAFSSDGQGASSAASHAPGVSLISNIAAYGFTVSPPSAAVSTPRLSFGSQLRRTASAARSVSLSNLGGGPLTLAGITTSVDFSASDTCGATLAAFASCTIAVTFTPPATGHRLGVLTIATSSDTGSATLSVELFGDGSDPGPPAFSPNPLAFAAPQVAGSTSASQAVTLTNNTGATLTISGFSLTTAPDFTEKDNCVGAPLAAGAFCTVNVTFAPTLSDTLASAGLGKNGLLQEGIVLNSNYTASNVILAVSGTGQAFAFAATTTTATVNPGQTGNFNLNIVPVGGYNQAPSLTCTTAANDATCSVSPTSTPLNGTQSVPIMVSVTTQAGSELSPRPKPLPPALRGPRVPLALWGLSLMALVGMALALRRKAKWRWLLLPAALGLILTWAACGGSQQAIQTVTGTQAGSWIVTVTGTAGSLTNSTGLTLNVN